MLRNYVIVTASYWGFTLVDGALRMLVLLHFFHLGYSPFTLAFLFLLYEAAGIAANLGGGWLASRFGIPRMLATGQILQIAGLLMFSALGPLERGACRRLGGRRSRHRRHSQGCNENRVQVRHQGHRVGRQQPVVPLGCLVHRLQERDERDWIFPWRVAAGNCWLRHALWLMAGFLAVILVAGMASLPAQLGKAKASKSVSELFAKSSGVNLLAAARIFMFGARDVWFVVGLPVFLYAAGWRFLEVGSFLALWTIAYGGIQALAPLLVTRSPDGLSREVPAARLWGFLLAAIPVALAIAMQMPGLWRPDLIIVAGLALFGLPFAVNSSLHSYLILAYAGSEKAAEDVGFYYAANAAGRLLELFCLACSIRQVESSPALSGQPSCCWRRG